MVLYDDDRFGAAESTLLRLGPGAEKPLPPRPAELLLLSKAQVSQSVTGNGIPLYTPELFVENYMLRHPTERQQEFILMIHDAKLGC